MNYIAKKSFTRLPVDQVSEILQLLRPLLRLSEASFKKTQADNITSAMGRILACLDSQGAQTVPALARTLGTGRQHIQRLVNDLFAMGLVIRKENPAHKKSRLIELTEDGYTHLKQAIDTKNNVFHALAKDLEGEDLQRCLEVLEHMMGNLDSLKSPPAAITEKPIRKAKARTSSDVFQNEPLEDLQTSELEPGSGFVDADESRPENKNEPVVLSWNSGKGLGID